MLAFVNDCDMASEEVWVEAVQYLGTKGFLRSYDVRPDDPLDPSTAACWAETAGALLDGGVDAGARARELPADRSSEGDGSGSAESNEGTTASSFADLLVARSALSAEMVADAREDCGIADGVLHRGEALQLVYRLVAP